MKFRIKDNDEKFDSVEEFVDNLNRGGEIEFICNKNKYSITHPEGQLCFNKIGDEKSYVFFESTDDLLMYKIDERRIKDIVTIIEPYFRSF